MPAYDDRFFNPPAPLAIVTLRTSGDVKVVTDVPMLIDSGADVSLVPQQSIAQLGVTVDADASYDPARVEQVFDLLVQQATKFEFIVNLKAVKQIG